MSATEAPLLSKLDSVAPSRLKEFDAFPKLPSTYKARSESRGFFTIFVAFLSFLFVLNDIGEWIWGWPDHEFSLDRDPSSYVSVNVDIIVNMPCSFLSVDLRDAVGDRLYLSEGFRRDGTLFDVGQATTLKAHSQALSASQAVSQSRKSRGLFATLFRSKPAFRPTYNHVPDGKACRVYGTADVKKVTANLHITTLGHGYASATHVDHSQMNLTHVINEFSFGPYFPDMTQPLDYSFEVAREPFVAYQYFLTVVPTTYIAPRSAPLRTNQYSVTHYSRVLEHNAGTPGIFFKFDLEPLSLTIHQRTTTFLQFIIRLVGVVGGVWCCMGWAIRVGYKAVEVASGADKTPGIVAAEATGVKKKWGGGELRSRVTRQGSGWVVEGGSPYGSYANTPVGSTFSPTPPLPPVSPSVSGPYSPALNGHSLNGNGNGAGLGLNSAGFGPGAVFPTGATAGSPYGGQSHPGSPYFPSTPHGSAFPPSPAPSSPAFPRSPLPGSPALAGQQLAPPPRRASGMDGKKAD